MRHVGSALLALALLGAPRGAAAEGAYVGVGAGPAVFLDGWPTQLRVEEEIGVYLDGAPRGFYLAFSPSQSWGNDLWTLVFPLRLGASFDLFRSSSMSFQLGPTGSVGLALSNTFNATVDTDVWFHFSFAFMLRLLVLEERLAFFVHPVGFEFALGDTARYGVEAIRYLASFGIQYYF